MISVTILCSCDWLCYSVPVILMCTDISGSCIAMSSQSVSVGGLFHFLHQDLLNDYCTNNLSISWHVKLKSKLLGISWSVMVCDKGTVWVLMQPAISMVIILFYLFMNLTACVIFVCNLQTVVNCRFHGSGCQSMKGVSLVVNWCIIEKLASFLRHPEGKEQWPWPWWKILDIGSMYLALALAMRTEYLITPVHLLATLFWTFSNASHTIYLPTFRCYLCKKLFSLYTV